MTSRSDNLDENNPRLPNAFPFNSSPDGQQDRIVNRADFMSSENFRSMTSPKTVSRITGKELYVLEDKVKRKRKSPTIPWKKPPGMPKRPLSAYNLFFQHQREILLKSAGLRASEPKYGLKNEIDSAEDQKMSPIASSLLPVTSSVLEETEQEKELNPKIRRHTRTSGIGFANLAKSISAKWRSIDPEERATFESQASAEKERYNREMMLWRSKQAKQAIPSNTIEKDNSKVAKRQSKHKRRQSSPPDSGADQPQDTQSRGIARRASEPIPSPGPKSDQWNLELSPSYESDSSSWAEDSVISIEESIGEDNLESAVNIDINMFRYGSVPIRRHSDSILERHLADFFNIRPCEDLSAEVSSRIPYERSLSVDQAIIIQDIATITSLRALSESLDDEMADFITKLGKKSFDE